MLDTPMIQLRDLTKSYGKTNALKGLTFEIPRGQVVGFLGPNGAGKSTTMRILTGYIPATSGAAIINGLDVSEHPLEARRIIGYLPENNPLYDDMMVIEYMEFVADLRQLPTSSRRAMINSALERCGLGSVRGKDIGTLSKGYRQRVGLAQAIVHDPPLLILDEPTSGLDPNQITEIRSLIKQLGQEKTVLMSTHILSEAQTTCSRVLIISDGKLVADDTPEQLVTKDGGAIQLALLPSNGDALDGQTLCRKFSGVVGVTRVESSDHATPRAVSLTVRYEGTDPRAALFHKVVEEKLVLIEMRRREMTLEETFRRLTME